jgi:hypothetical protein
MKKYYIQEIRSIDRHIGVSPIFVIQYRYIVNIILCTESMTAVIFLKTILTLVRITKVERWFPMTHMSH